MLRIALPEVAGARLARLCALAVVVACAGAAPWIASPPKAEAAPVAPDCGVRKLCLYSGVDWTGRVITISERELRRGNFKDPGDAGITLIDPRMKGRVSSWINTTTLKLCGLESALEAFSSDDELLPSDDDEILWTGSRFTRDPYVGDKVNNETDFISIHC
jgi:hypothetical protein